MNFFESIRDKEGIEFHKEELTSIMNQLNRYPGRSVVGCDYELVAWMIIHQCDLVFMKNTMPYLETAVSSKDLHPMFLADVIDKIEIAEGRHQIYGTQFVEKEGKKIYYPVIDPPYIESRRRSMGLAPHGDQYHSFSQLYTRDKGL